MRPDDLRKLLKRQPFHPFRLCISDGASYDIVHPEMANVLRGAIQIVLPVSGVLNVPVERVILVSLLHIARVEVYPPGGMYPTP